MAANTRTFATHPEATENQLLTLRRAREQWLGADDPVSRLHRRMATTLSLELLLAIFADELSRIVPHGQLTYRHRIGNQEFVYSTGLGGNHRCDYQLTLEGTCYGSLTLTRRRRFAEEELEAIEFLLSVLICPLRNACQYTAVEQAALTDSLTGIPNKRALDMALSRDCSIGDRHGDTCTLILCDLDHFKTINDTHGHVIGDHILQEVAEALRAATREGDGIFRFGGEEFAVLLPHTDFESARDVANRIRDEISNISVSCGQQQVRVTSSAGVATRRRGERPQEWVARADDALYRAKAAGRNCTRIAHALDIDETVS
ncbi:GGDEF domain-containing protein [uncultured Marinobacter sp.]|uniref:GGDEF domain-containing protein n=1 Tax=uncultured Marinobacter sp. TaxID=187379 RepID=UPI0030DA1207